jgi:hypothetical protein
MNHQISSRISSFLSGLAAIALTTIIATTLVESVKPVLALSSSDQFATANAAEVDGHGTANLVRNV